MTWHAIGNADSVSVEEKLENEKSHMLDDDEDDMGPSQIQRKGYFQHVLLCCGPSHLQRKGFPSTRPFKFDRTANSFFQPWTGNQLSCKNAFADWSGTTRNLFIICKRTQASSDSPRQSRPPLPCYQGRWYTECFHAQWRYTACCYHGRWYTECFLAQWRYTACWRQQCPHTGAT